MEYLSASHAFNYIILRINSGLTTCKGRAMMVDTVNEERFAGLNFLGFCGFWAYLKSFPVNF